MQDNYDLRNNQIDSAQSLRKKIGNAASLQKLPTVMKPSTSENFNKMDIHCSKTERFFTPRNFAYDAEKKVLQKNTRLMSNPILKSDLKRNLESIKRSNRGEARTNKNFFITSRAFNKEATQFNHKVEKIKGAFNSDDFINLTKEREKRMAASMLKTNEIKSQLISDDPFKKADIIYEHSQTFGQSGWPDEIPKEHLNLFHYVENKHLKSLFENGNMQEVYRGAINNNDVDFFIKSQANLLESQLKSAYTILQEPEENMKHAIKMVQIWIIEMKRWSESYNSCARTMQVKMDSQKKDHEALQLEQKKIGDSMGYNELISFYEITENYNKYFGNELNGLQGPQIYLRKDSMVKSQNELSKKMLAAKSALKVKSDSGEKQSSILDNTEELLKNSMDTIKNILNEHQALRLENDYLQNYLDKHKSEMQLERDRIRNVTENLKDKMGPSMVELSKKMEESFADKIKKYEKDIKDYQGQIEEKEKKIEHQHDQMAVLKANLQKTRCKKVDKETEAKFLLGDVKQQVKILSNIFDDLKVTFITGVTQKNTWLTAMINFILNQKFIKDLQDDFERRTTSDLRSFLIEFFLEKFGTMSVASQILKDFIVTLKKFANETERFRMFAKLIGFHDMVGTNITQRNSGFCRDAQENAFLESSDGIRYYLKFCMVVDSFAESRYGKPFVPFGLSRNTSLLKIECVKNAYMTILSKEHLPSDVLEKYENDFSGLLQSDLYYRISDDANLNLKAEESQISLDLVISYVLNLKAKELIDGLEVLYNSLKINNKASWNEGELSYDDMRHSMRSVMSKKSDSFISSCFSMMIDTPQKKGISIGRMMENAIPLFLNETKAKQSYSSYILTPFENDERLSVLSESYKKDDEILKKLAFTKKEQIFKMKNQMLASAEFNSKIKAKRNEGLISGAKDEKNKDKLKLNNQSGLIFTSTDAITSYYYDNISAMAALQETYEMLKESIINFEKMDETISTIHFDIKEFMKKFTLTIVARVKFEEFLEHDQTVLHKDIENCWKKLRKVLSKAIKSNN